MKCVFPPRKSGKKCIRHMVRLFSCDSSTRFISFHISSLHLTHLFPHVILPRFVYFHVILPYDWFIYLRVILSHKLVCFHVILSIDSFWYSSRRFSYFQMWFVHTICVFSRDSSVWSIRLFSFYSFTWLICFHVCFLHSIHFYCILLHDSFISHAVVPRDSFIFTRFFHMTRLFPHGILSRG